MKVATVNEVREIDKLSITKFEIPGIVLMENAGLHVLYQTEKVLGQIKHKKICIFCGKGNNGGDGFVAARHLYNRGARVKVFCLAVKEEISGDARINLNIMETIGVEIIYVESERDWDKLKLAAAFADCLIDALVGTGFQGELNPTFVKAVNIINTANKITIAVDIPTGVNADNGIVENIAVKATHTVTFALPKLGLLLYPGAQYTGELTIADIGIPVSLLTTPNIRQNIITTEDVRKVLPVRSLDAHKGSCGKVLVVAGSRGFTGAAALTSLGALRAGAGLVTLGIAESLNDIMEVKLTEVMTKPLADNDGAINLDSADVIVELTEKNDVLAIGPGLGINPHTSEAVRKIVTNVNCPLVIDADGLNAIAGYADMLKDLPALAILTPHPGEMSRLTGLTVDEINSDRINISQEYANKWGQIIVLKGAPTVVAFPDGEVYVNTTGNAGLATGGTGDILTGIIAGFLAQGLSSHDAALAGVYIHGLAADIVCQEASIGILAGEFLPAIPSAIFGVLSD